MDAIRIEGLDVDCVVGLYPHERRGRQRVVVDLALYLDLSNAGRTGRIANTCDYDQVANLVRELLKFRRYQLIEAATEEIAALLLGVHPAVGRVDIRFVKPSALPGRARSASVEITRMQADFPRTQRPTEAGTLETLLETHEAGLYLLQVPPGRSLETIAPSEHRQHSWLVAGELRQESRRIATGQRLELPTVGAAYEVAGEQPALVLACACPPLGV